MVAGFLLSWSQAIPILSLSLSGRLPIVALFQRGMMFIPCNREVNGSNVFQLMTCLMEEIDVFDIIVRERSFQNPCKAMVDSYTYMGFVLDKIALISEL